MVDYQNLRQAFEDKVSELESDRKQFRQAEDQLNDEIWSLKNSLQ